MAWKDYLLGVATVFSMEFLGAGIGVIVALLRSERATNRLLKAAVRPRDEAND